jgi:hypothetical protein
MKTSSMPTHLSPRHKTHTTTHAFSGGRQARILQQHLKRTTRTIENYSRNSPHESTYRNRQRSSLQPINKPRPAELLKGTTSRTTITRRIGRQRVETGSQRDTKEEKIALLTECILKNNYQEVARAIACALCHC